jgi:hypothetical protein
MTIERSADKDIVKTTEPARALVAAFAVSAIVSLFLAASVALLWYGGSLRDDIALDSRIVGADCLVLVTGRDLGPPPRVRFYAPAADEWIDASLVATLGRHGHKHLRYPETFLARHPPGDIVACYYDPDEPTSGVAISPRVGGLYARLMACGVTVLVLASIGGVSMGLAVAAALSVRNRHADPVWRLEQGVDSSVHTACVSDSTLRGFSSRWHLLDAILADRPPSML